MLMSLNTEIEHEPVLCQLAESATQKARFRSSELTKRCSHSVLVKPFGRPSIAEVRTLRAKCELSECLAALCQKVGRLHSLR